MSVVLIGFSGTGKSTVGRLLAERLGWGFVDTDSEVERSSGKPIHDIFAEEGEAAFRRMESAAVRQALESGPQVVAVGGGAVLDPSNRAAMRDGHLVVLLDASVETLHRRLAADVVEEPRPMLGMGTGGPGDGGTRRRGDGGEGPERRQPSPDHRSRISALKASREGVYRETAHLVVDAEGTDVEGVVARILDALDHDSRAGKAAAAAAALQDRRRMDDTDSH